MSYDDASKLIRVQDARGYSVSYTLDAVGNIVNQTSGDAEITYTYDGNCNVLTIKDPDNKTKLHLQLSVENRKAHKERRKL